MTILELLDNRPQLHHFFSVSSTMDVCKFLPVGSVVLANFQENGRGKPGNRWICKGGNLMFSCVVRKHDHLFGLFAVAVGRSIRSVGCKDSVVYKYPNDIYLGGRKICGVLVENERDSAIVGVGLNLADDVGGIYNCLKNYGIDISALCMLNIILNMRLFDWEREWLEGVLI